ncbi:MAG: hypothetical protein KUG77_05790, partial [Nannocystaceae bacterium]|nr:hypothetical protein [Nannocystaceae bacterium]
MDRIQSSTVATIAVLQGHVTQGAAALALCTTGLEPEAAEDGLAWLGSHQQADGSWRGQSLNGPGRTAERYMTDASTGYAVLALSTCAPR